MRRNRRPQCLFGMILLLVMLVTAVAVQAQTTPAPTPSPAPSPAPSLEHDFLKNIWRDQRAIWTAPLHLDRSDAKWAVPGTIGWLALVSTDRMTGDEIGESERQVKWSRHISNAGSIYSLAAVAGTFYFAGRAKQNDRARETGLLSAEAIIDSVIVEGVLKGVSRRGRPLDGLDRSEFFEGGSSFPSGHATQTWALATVIANEYKGHPAVQIAAYSVATAVGIARFTGHKHYLSDVVAGSALGWGIGRYVYHTHHRDFRADQNTVTKSAWPLVSPGIDRATHQYSVALTWNF